MVELIIKHKSKIIMETLIKAVEKAIEDAKWNVNYHNKEAEKQSILHSEMAAASLEQQTKLESELEELRKKLA